VANPDPIRWFFDESVLGAGKRLAQRRTDVVHPGHPAVLEIPLGALDTEWMPIVAGRGWLAFARDRRIRTKPAEIDVFLSTGLRMVWFAGKQDLRPDEQATLFERHLVRLEQHIVKAGPGPWGLLLRSNGLAPITLMRRS
jgi:hypothetical protein